MIGYEERAYRVMVKSYVSLRFTLLGVKPGNGLVRIYSSRGGGFVGNKAQMEGDVWIL